MNLKRVVEALVSLGLSHTEARIYVFLEKSGSREDKEIAKALRLHTKELISNLEKLQDKQIVQASAQQIIEFSAVPFEKAIDLLIKLKKEKAQILQDRKLELLSMWQTMTKKKAEHN